MATYWKLSRTSIGNYDFRKTQVEKDARYLYRHGDYFDTRDEERTFRRRSVDVSSTELLEDVRNTLSSEYVYNLVQNNYKSDDVSEVTVDKYQLTDDGQWVDERYVGIATLAGTKVDYQKPTFETSRYAVSKILNPQPETSMNWDEVWADLGVTAEELSLG